MTRKQTSTKVSRLAAKYMAASDIDIIEMMTYDREVLLSNIRTLAASCLSQDEIKGDSADAIIKRGKKLSPAQRRKRIMDVQETLPASAIKAMHPELTDVDIVNLMAGEVVFKTSKPMPKNTVPTMKMPKRTKP